MEGVLIDELHRMWGEVRRLDADPLLDDGAATRIDRHQLVPGLIIDVASDRA